MKENYLDYLEKITDPRSFKIDEWYRMPKKQDLIDFLHLFKKSFPGCLEFEKSGFRIIAYPTITIKYLREDKGKDISKLLKIIDENELEEETIDGL